MKVWAVQDAKARFSEMLDACIRNGPQLVTKRGADAAVLVPVEEWNRMQQEAGPTLKSVLLGDGWRGDLPLPQRGLTRRRSLPNF
jgi:antitoxin Phd